MSNEEQNRRHGRRSRGGPMGGPPGMMGGEKARNFKGTMGRLFSYMKHYHVSMIIVLIFAIAGTVFMVVGPKILGQATDVIADGMMQKAFYKSVAEQMPEGYAFPEGTTGADVLKMLPEETKEQLPEAMLNAVEGMDMTKTPGIDLEKVGRIMVWLIGLYILSALFTYVQSYVMAGVAQKVSYRLRKDISEKINKLPLSYYDKRTHGDVLSRVTNDVDTVSQTLNQSLAQMITSVTTIVGVLYMMFSINWLLTLMTMLILPVSMGLISGIVKRSQKYFKQQQQFLADVNGHVEEMFSGHNVVKAFNREKVSIEGFDKINKKLYSSAWKSQFLSGMMMPIMGFVGNIGYVGICVVGGWLSTKGRVTIGGIQSFIQYVRQFNQPIGQLASITNTLQSTAAAAERVFEFLGEPEESAEPESPAKLADVRGEVVFDHVEFGYDPEKIIIHDFSSRVQPGKRIAIVGPTGAGKTTIVKLLMRFYDVNKGAITVDGVDITKLTRADLRSAFGMVLQDTWLFNGTIRENIRYGRLDATDGEVIAAARAAHVDHFVRSLPGGYDMVLNEEASNISQGQKQLLTIARAFLADPKLLILDEATSSVDTRTEILIQKAMDKLMQNRTSFIIAHRLSTIRDADLILVMKDGDIVEQGNHRELMEQGGFYASLYNSQFETAVNE